MSLKDKIVNKLQPHADRILEDKNDEFDYLPGVLVHLLQEQEKQSIDNVKHLAALSKNLNQTTETANIQLNQNLTQLKLSIETETKKMRLLLIASLILSGLAVAAVIYLATK